MVRRNDMPMIFYQTNSILENAPLKSTFKLVQIIYQMFIVLLSRSGLKFKQDFPKVFLCRFSYYFLKVLGEGLIAFEGF